MAGISWGSSAALLAEALGCWTPGLSLTSLPSLTIADLSASDDSSLSDGLLLEEGELGSLGTQSRPRGSAVR